MGCSRIIGAKPGIRENPVPGPHHVLRNGLFCNMWGKILLFEDSELPVGHQGTKKCITGSLRDFPEDERKFIFLAAFVFTPNQLAILEIPQSVGKSNGMDAFKKI